jgi:hypothetical protein
LENLGSIAPGNFIFLRSKRRSFRAINAFFHLLGFGKSSSHPHSFPQVDHWQYVFGSERPRPNRNYDAGLDVSPAVREYLGMSGIDVCDWKFENVYAIPNGPWALFGENNTLAHLRPQIRAGIVRK